MDENKTLEKKLESFIEGNIGLEKTSDWGKTLPGKNGDYTIYRFMFEGRNKALLEDTTETVIIKVYDNSRKKGKFSVITKDEHNSDSEDIILSKINEFYNHSFSLKGTISKMIDKELSQFLEKKEYGYPIKGKWGEAAHEKRYGIHKIWEINYLDGTQTITLRLCGNGEMRIKDSKGNEDVYYKLKTGVNEFINLIKEPVNESELSNTEAESGYFK